MKKADIEIIRSPTSVNWSELHQFLHTNFAYMEDRIDPPSSLKRMGVNDLQKKAELETLIVAKSDCRLVGCLFCRVQGRWLYVGKAAVDQTLRRSGIARLLFDEAFEVAKSHHLDGLELETRVELTENHRAFSRLGFEKVGEDAHPGFDRPTSIRMRARLELNG